MKLGFRVEGIHNSALGSSMEPQSFIYRVGSVSQDTQVALWDFEVDLTLSTPRSIISLFRMLQISFQGVCDVSQDLLEWGDR